MKSIVKYRKSSIILFFLLLAIIGNSLLYAQIRHQVVFKSGYELREFNMPDGKVYQSIQMPDMKSGGDTGVPAVPFQLVRILIPADAEITGVQVAAVKTQTTKLQHPLAPTQMSVPTSAKAEDIKFVPPLKSIYESNVPFPPNRAEIFEIEGFRGNRIAALAVYPFLYYPKSGEIVFTPTINITLDYRQKTPAAESIYQKAGSGQNDTKETLRKHVVNTADIDRFTVDINPSSTQTLASALVLDIRANCEYVIVTPRALIPAFAEFMAWKKRKGVDIQIRAMEDIKLAYAGDAISRIYDDAGKLRQFLSDSYKMGKLRYALLAGDHTMVPIRYCHVVANTQDPSLIIPTDQYFTEFSGNWNVDGDNCYGEIQGDDPNYRTHDIAVGRLMAVNAEEVKNWTRKLIKYERNPGNGDYAYLKKAFLTQADQMQNNREAKILAEKYLLPCGFDTVIFEERGGGNTSYRPSFPTGKNVIDEFNKHYGICSFMAHGSPAWIGVATKGYNEDGYQTKHGIMALDSYTGYECYVPETGNGFDNMTNVDYPSIYHSTSCETMPFDDYLHTPDVRNMGEAYTVISKGGGPAYLGNTRLGWGASSPISDFQEGMTNDVFRAVLVNLKLGETIGSAMAWSRHCSSERSLKTKASYNLLGCPEMRVWLNIPKKFTSADVFAFFPLPGGGGQAGTQVNTGGIDSTTICIKSLYDNSYYEVRKNVSSASFYNVPGDYIVTITKPGYIPYVKNPDNLYIQNQNFTSDAFIQANNYIYAGSNVTGTKPQGPVVIGNGNFTTGVTLKAKEVTLTKDFEVKQDVTFCIEPE